jgi:hypothetical protein
MYSLGCQHCWASDGYLVRLADLTTSLVGGRLMVVALRWVAKMRTNETSERIRGAQVEEKR